MSFDLGVFAMDESADAEAAGRMYERCGGSGPHVEGELDERVVAFYEQLRARFPDYPPYDPDSPWMSMPLDVGIDHVIMHLSFSPVRRPAIDAIMRLAAQHRLVLYDPQSGDVSPPGG